MLDPIKTRRLLLRPLRFEDAGDYHALETASEVKQFLGGATKLSVEQYQSSIASSALGLAMTLAVTAANTGQFLGRCWFTEYTEFCEPVGWEINIVLHWQYWRGGYATELGLALIPRGFTILGCDKLLGVVDAANIGSVSLCGRLGMKFESDTTRYGRPARIYAVTKHA